jgi:hypothetical protein
MTTKTVTHLYVSIRCQHDRHLECLPPHCAVCESPCLCPCHLPVVKADKIWGDVA